MNPQMNGAVRRAGRWAALACTLLLCGCAALQVDVDVYKGPLANTEETQVQQLASMALTAKPLISTMRNRLIETYMPFPTGQSRVGHISEAQWQTHVASKFADLQRGSAGQLDLQRATQLNAVLSFYDDRDGVSLAPVFDDLRAAVNRYESAMRDFRRGLTDAEKQRMERAGIDSFVATANDATVTLAFTQAQIALMDVWSQAGAMAQQQNRYWPPQAGRAGLRKTVQRSMARLLAQLTQPVLYACGRLSRQQLALNLEADDPTDALNKLRNYSPSVSSCTTTSTVSGLGADESGTLAQALRNPVADRGVVRSPSALEPLPLGDLVGAVQNASDIYLGGTSAGFDRGRPALGIESLADNVSRSMYYEQGIARSTERERNRAEKQLAQMLVDLSGRMQFLATNLWLIDAGDITSGIGREQQETFKALLETVANTLMVQADQQRVHTAYEARQESAVKAELAAMAGKTVGRTGTATLNPFGASAGPGRGESGGYGTAIEVVDAVIAQLEYRRIDALARGGDSAEARQITQALDQARQRRAGMTFVRPSSAYLRSAFASTFSQTGASLRWQNMLNDTLGNAFGGQSGEARRKADIRDSLDKAYWQNINTVRVSAAGSSNYVLAKDDVGNWYVKAMGNDPKAMVNAAKNLALFNAGGKIDADLLRMNQLQTRLDSLDDDTGTDAGTKRQSLTSQIEELQEARRGGGSFGATSERSTTLGLFRANYANQAARDLGALSAGVQGLPASVSLRWQTSVSDAARRTRLDALATTLTPSFSKVTASLAATGSASAVIVASLQALDAYRRELQAAVAGNADLVKTEQDADTLARNALAPLEAQQLAAEQTLALAGQSVTQAQQNLNGAQQGSPQNPTLVAQMQSALEAAQAGQVKAASDLVARSAALRDARTRAELASGNLGKARLERAAAATDVGAVISPVILEAVARRLRSVQELETAANVVGRRSP